MKFKTIVHNNKFVSFVGLSYGFIGYTDKPTPISSNGMFDLGIFIQINRSEFSDDNPHNNLANHFLDSIPNQGIPLDVNFFDEYIKLAKKCNKYRGEEFYDEGVFLKFISECKIVEFSAINDITPAQSNTRYSKALGREVIHGESFVIKNFKKQVTYNDVGGHYVTIFYKLNMHAHIDLSDLNAKLIVDKVIDLSDGSEVDPKVFWYPKKLSIKTLKHNKNKIIWI